MTVHAEVGFDLTHLTLMLRDQRTLRLRYDIAKLMPFTQEAGNRDVLDLLELSLALYALDRLIPRSHKQWSRTFRVTYPVAELRYDRWLAVKSLFESLVRSATGDELQLRIVRRRKERHAAHAIVPFSLFDSLAPVVSLFSEGLDSFAGVAGALGVQEQPHVLVSVLSNSHRQNRVRKLSGILRSAFLWQQMGYLSLDTHFAHLPPNTRQEKTQRFRSFVAISAGLTVAAAYHSNALVIHENGIGILNLPFVPMQTLHESSQALHPRNLRQWEVIAKILLGNIAVETPNRFRTKAEMIAQLPAHLQAEIAFTSSCDGIPRRRGVLHADCGHCGSCAYRRLSIECAGLQDTTEYSNFMPPNDVDAFRVLRRQAAQWRSDFATADPWAALNRRQPSLEDSFECVKSEARHGMVQATLELLRRHCAEVLDHRSAANVA